MKYKLPDGQELKLKPLTDEDFDLVQRLSTRSLDTCPTCGGRREEIAPGIKVWKSNGYRYKDKDWECNCQAQIALYARYRLANIGDQYMRLDWNDFAGTAQADQWVRDYTANWRGFFAHGFGLTFSSARQGVGKTFAATHIAKELIKQRQKVYFQDFVQMVDAFMSEDKRDVETRMKMTNLLVLDDVLTGFSERQNDLYALKLESVIRHRTNYNLPTIFTTNLSEKHFEDGFPRIYSLIMPKQVWINMNGVDHRKLSETGIETAEMIARGEVQPIT